MIYQQRPFFRKKIKLPTRHSINSLSVFKNHGTMHRDVNMQKLTPHKFKRTSICIHVASHFYHTGVMRFLKIVDLQLSALNFPYTMIYRDTLGVIYKSFYIQGGLVNTILTHSIFFKHICIHIESMNYKSTGTNLVTFLRPVNSSKIFGSNSYHLITLQNDGSLLLKLATKTKIFTESSFILGLSTKFNSRNISRVSSVRGIAKNPIDHPNGGRANTKGSFKTPWGSIAKFNK